MQRHYRILAVFSLIALVLFTLESSAGALTASEIEVKGDPPIEGVLDFQGCVRLALQQSPYLTSSSLEIDVKNLDLSDAKYSFVPTFSIRTLYYLNPPPPIPGVTTFQPYVIQFITDPYNPIEVYYSMRVQQSLTRIAVYAHLQTIADYLQRLAVGFLQLESLDRMAEYQDEIIPVAQQDLAFTKKLLTTGGASLADVDIAEQALAVASAEKERLAVSRATIVDGIKDLIGLKSTAPPLELDVKSARSQVLNDFSSTTATLEEAKSNSFALKSAAEKKKLQEKNVTLTYLRYLPHFVWGVVTADPLTGRDLTGLYVTVGLEMPIWDAMKRYHDISRQKDILKQDIAEGEVKESDLAAKWREAEEKIKDTCADLKLAEAQERLAVLKERQAEISYKAGGKKLTVYLTEQKARLDAQKSVVAKKLDYDKAVLTLRILSGDLINHFVSVGSFYDKVD